MSDYDWKYDFKLWAWGGCTVERLIDREKVSKGLECCAIPGGDCPECPYDKYGIEGLECENKLVADALTLLKADQAELIRQHERIESLESFALWVAKSVLSDDWDTDHDFYSEVICRKLVDLGYIKKVKDRYVGAEWSAEGDRKILNAPTVDVAEQRTGRWKKVYGDHVYMGFRPWTVCCSECGMIGGGTRYCSNCGAKMEQDDEEM